MASDRYLAMTASEIAAVQTLPVKIAWMACHFSPYGTGLSNLPASLPANSLLILNDRIPICGHDHQRIAQQLQQAAEVLKCFGILLDFQQPQHPELAQLAAVLVSSLPCPVAVSEGYAQTMDCPIFLSPCPHHTHLSEYLAPWQGRDLWMDLAVDAEEITLTKEGATFLPLFLSELPEHSYQDEHLHCHYATQTGDDFARFSLWRTQEDLECLALEAETLGVKTFVGLYQEFQTFSKSGSIMPAEMQKPLCKNAERS